MITVNFAACSGRQAMHLARQLFAGFVVVAGLGQNREVGLVAGAGDQGEKAE